MLNSPVNGKIQGLFKAFVCVFKDFSRQIRFSRTFQDSPVYSSTFQACANPVHMRVVVNTSSLPVYKKYLIALLLFIHDILAQRNR